jgi:hypothetical protein
MSVHKVKIISLAVPFISNQIAGGLIPICGVDVGIAVLVDFLESRLTFVVYSQTAIDLILVPGGHPPFISRVVYSDRCDAVRPGRGGGLCGFG